MSDQNQELIVYVNKDGTPTGETAPKLDAHTATTRLHAAFSCYVFNKDGKFLVTQRAYSKKVWPGVWTNSVCGHLAPNETCEKAILRRAKYELGAKVKDIKVILPTYIYKTPPVNGIIENEFCPVYLARIDSNIFPNPEEVENYKWISWSNFCKHIKNDTKNMWSFWCKDQIKRFDPNILNPFTDGL